MKVNRFEDIRVLIWLQDQLLWLSLDKPDYDILPNYVSYRFDTRSVFNFRDRINYFPIVPTNVNVTLKTTGPNSASLTFLITRDKLYFRQHTKLTEERFMGNIFSEDDRKKYETLAAWKDDASKKGFCKIYTLPVELYDALNTDYFEEFYKVLEEVYGSSNRGWKFPETMIPASYETVDKDAQGTLSYSFSRAYKRLSWPLSVFQPMYPIWIDVRDETGQWRALFTGYIDGVNESISAGNRRQITIECYSSLKLLDVIPAFPNIMEGLFWNGIIDSRYGNTEKGEFLKLYFKKITVQNDPTFWPNYWQDKKPIELIRYINEVANFRLGIMSESEIKSIKTSKEGLSWSSEDSEKFHKLFVEHGFHKFSFFGYFDPESKNYKIESYKGRDNVREGFDHILLRQVADDESRNASYSSYEVLESLGQIYVAPELVEEDLPDAQDLIQIFQRVIGYSVAYFHPQRQNLSVVLKKISNTLKLDVYNTPQGDLIVEFPRINYKPRLVPVRDLTSKKSTLDIRNWFVTNTGKTVSTERISDFYSEYQDHDGRYIFTEQNVITLSTHKSGSQVKAEYQVKGAPDIVSLNELITTSLYSGFGFARPELILRFGLQEAGSDTYYFATIGSGAEDLEKIQKFANDLAETFLQQYNAKGIISSARLVNRTDLLPGRTFLDTQREMLYYISQVSYSVTPGQNINTTVNGTFGHPFDMHITEVPEIFVKYRDLKLPKITFVSSTQLSDDKLLWSLASFGCYRSIKGSYGRKTDLANASVAWLEQIYAKLLARFQSKLSLKSNQFEGMFQAGNLIYILSNNAPSSDRPELKDAFDFSKAKDYNDVVYLSWRLALHLIYIRFLFWVVVQKIALLGALTIFFVSKKKKSLEDAFDMAAKLTFFHLVKDEGEGENDTSKPDSKVNLLSSLPGDPKSGGGQRITILDGSVGPEDPKAGGISIVKVYESMLKKLDKFHEVFFGTSDDDITLEIDFDNPQLKQKLEKKTERWYDLGAAGRKPICSQDIEGWFNVRLGVWSLWREQQGKTKSRHPLSRAADIDVLRVEFTTPVKMLAFLIGLDLLMLSKPIFYFTEEGPIGAWTLPPVYSGKKRDSSGLLIEVPEKIKNAWFSWYSSALGSDEPWTNYVGVKGEYELHFGEAYYRSWIRWNREVVKSRRNGYKIRLLGLQLLIGYFLKSDDDGTKKTLSEGGFSSTDTFGRVITCPSGSGDALGIILENAWEEQGNIFKDLDVWESNKQLARNWLTALINEEYIGKRSIGTGDGSDIRCIIHSDQDTRKLRIDFNIRNAGSRLIAHGSFLFSIVAAAYRWAWKYHYLVAADKGYRFVEYDGTYRFSDGMAYQTYPQPPVLLSKIVFYDEDGRELYYCPGLSDWFEMAPIYLPFSAIQRYVSGDPNKPAAAASPVSVYKRMTSVFDSSEVKQEFGEIVHDLEVNFDNFAKKTGILAASSRYETFLGGLEWRNWIRLTFPWGTDNRYSSFPFLKAHMNHFHMDVGYPAPNIYLYWVFAFEMFEREANDFERSLFSKMGIKESFLKRLLEQSKSGE